MGAYGSVPVMDIESESDANDFITYCSSSVQGWRISQEDAHLNKMLIDADTKASLFGVFDGHGGAEVAKYTATKLLEVLKENEHFNKDSINIAKALKESFLKLDSQIADPNNKAALEEFLSDEDESDDDEEEVAALFDEADQPIDKLIEKYGGEENIPAETKELLNKRRQSQPIKKDDVLEEDNEEDDAKKDMSSVSLKEEQFKKEEQEAIANGDEKKEEENGDKEAEKAEGEEDDDEDDYEDYSEDSDDSSSGDSSDDSNLDADEVRRMLSEEPSPGFSSGTTACVCLVVPDKKTNKVRLVTANAGDSRAVLCRNGKYVDLSLDHKPEAEIELARIKAAGGTVNSEGRVCGGLNLSRAIGDHNYKKREDLGLAEQIITANPDISEVELDPKADKFVVIACDGIWNSLTSQEVVDFINARLDDISLLRRCRKEIPTADDDSTEEESSEDEESDEKSGEKKTEETNGKSPEKKKEEKAESEDKKEKNGDSANGSKSDVKKEDEEEKPLPTDQAGILKEICEDLFHHVLAEKTSMDSVGCDNMTCSIIMLNNLEAYSKEAGVELEEISTSLPDQSANTTDIPCKKRKLPESDIEESDAKKVKSC